MSFSDPRPDLEQWLRTELARPVPSTARARQRLMERIRAEPVPSARPAAHGGGSRGGHPRTRLYGLALAAGISGIMALEVTHPLGGPDAVAPGARLVDTVSDALVDTLRVVRFMLVAPAAGQVALVGDFNRWDPRATKLERAGDAWSTSLALAHGRHRYAFVVDDTQWIADPAAARGAEVGGRRASVLEIPEARE